MTAQMMMTGQMPHVTWYLTDRSLKVTKGKISKHSFYVKFARRLGSLLKCWSFRDVRELTISHARNLMKKPQEVAKAGVVGTVPPV